MINFLSVLRASLLVTLLAAVAACTGDLRTDRTIAAERANAYVAAHPELPAATAEDIGKLRVVRGMTMEQAIAA